MSQVDLKKLTPMMKQYFEIKSKFEDSILLFRLGDFYEMFSKDAEIAAKVLDIVLTARECGGGVKIPMCGFPYHASDSYIKRLVSNGYKVAICEQLEDPKDAKGIVKRDVIKVISPGTIIDGDIQSGNNNYLMSVFFTKFKIGISYVDVSTGEVSYTELNNLSEPFLSLQNEIVRVGPNEILINSDLEQDENFKNILKSEDRLSVTYISINSENQSIYYNHLKSFISAKSLDLLKTRGHALISLSNLYEYIYKFQEDKLSHLKEPFYVDPSRYMDIDGASRRNLEIIPRKDNEFSLISVLDKTITPMGSRNLKSWIENPLTDLYEIKKRQDLVEVFYESSEIRSNLENFLKKCGDLERVLGRLSYRQGSGKDLIALKQSISMLEDLKLYLLDSNPILSDYGNKLNSLSDIFQLIDSAIVEEPPTSIKEGKIIKIGFSEQLDNLRETSINGENKLIEYELEEKVRTQIKSLKIVFNKKTGYFIDITKANKDLVPDSYHKVQTLTNSDRYITNDLKEIELMISTSESESIKLEEEIFESIRLSILEESLNIQSTSNILAFLDTCLSLANVAVNKSYVKPTFNVENLIDIKKGRHPIIEESMKKVNFIPNDTYIGSGDNLIQIITGPNMSGKSTYLRQIALISLMGQIGSFVPAESASLAIIDKIFTRIGASDNIVLGDSTFMVEMKESAYIIENATENSLILLDEVGRGTSTYDGLSIAWAIVEYLSKDIKAKTLFATHYHELTDLEDYLNNVKNFCICVEEAEDEVVFLHKIIQGRANKSFGIQVAEIAGFPKSLTDRAKTILSSIERKNYTIDKEGVDESQSQLNEIQKDAFLTNIAQIDLNNLSPLESINKLNSLIREAEILLGD